MAKYKRLFVYKSKTLVSQTLFLRKDLTIEYNIQGLVGKDLTIMYDILKTDARSLWEPKEVGQALWEPSKSKDPSDYSGIVIVTPTTQEYLMDESGDYYLMDEAEDYYIMAESE